MRRNPNFNCKVCNKEIYKRPVDINKGHVYCSRVCAQSVKKRPSRQCKQCGKEFVTKHSKNKFCSHICSNIGRTNIKYKKHSETYNNASALRLIRLQEAFNFSSCMVDGCSYNKTYDIHRLLEGKNGGEYVIGNMFAICPNHHAEVHRKICRFVKVSDSKLIAEY